MGFGRYLAHSRKKFLTDLHRRENEAGLSSGGQLFKVLDMTEEFMLQCPNWQVV